MADTFDSSDVEYEAPVPKLNKSAGQASIARLVQDGENDRLTSKKTVKQLTFGSGAKTTRYQQALWVNRFEVFREHTLKQALDKPFKADDLIRFLDTILSKKKLKLRRGKPAPNDDLAWDAAKIIISYGSFRWAEEEGFKFKEQHRLRLKTFVDDCVRSGRLTAGNWYKRTWIGFVTLSRMVRMFLAEASDKGTASWDLTISRCLSIVIVGALGCRAGDVAISRGYDGNEYLQYQHIELFLEENDQSSPTQPAKLDDVRAVITLQYTKGMKNRAENSPVKFLSPLLDPSCYHVCPITLLLIHALRHGMFEGGQFRSIQQVLDHAAQRPDRKIAWKYPTRPLLPMFLNGPLRCNLDMPAPTNQLLTTIKSMGQVSGMLDRAYTHGLRLGASRDLAHFESKKSAELLGAGVAHDEIRRSLGHNSTTTAKGTTDRYIGDTGADFYQARASAKPGVAGSVRRGRLDKLRDNVMQEPTRSRQQASVASEPSPLPQQMRRTGKTLARAPLVDLSSNTPVKRKTLDDVQDAPSANGEDISIDPVLLAYDQRSLNVSDAQQMSDEVPQDVQALCSIVFPEGGDTIEATTEAPPMVDVADLELQDEVARCLAGDDLSPTKNSGVAFVDAYSCINVVSNMHFAQTWSKYEPGSEGSFQQTIGMHSTRGHSKDDPTPFQYRCRVSPECDHMELLLHKLERHEARCTKETSSAMNDALAIAAANQSKLEAGTLSNDRRCSQPDCSYVVIGKPDDQVKAAMKKHVYNVHDWEPKPCEHGCEPEKTYASRSSYTAHKSNSYSGRWPTHCSFPGCTETKTFNGPATLGDHLSRKHGLASADERKPYYPAAASGKPSGRFAAQSCIVTGCESEQTFKAVKSLQAHLVSAHSMEETAATTLIHQNARYESAASSGKGPSSRQVMKALESQAPQPPAAKKRKT
ncbi:hypothetical protein M409DRAFT_50624 [Zasmidium cellare ATCC 36951]|uniref:C2H2-type domain-containing protein n=1 Tax=Zasmidium cellare ATCC 36951 TaxID=1080233 RepID=A0A6A6D1R8_ZASCE|nr:uncharacterized protein M409DRAFT_50624 [Zasmidium cellare ATCC 36951]KAF2172029.1 hypothetical protein M409DRAFT_50624 [Zasmidium cellare ATCC 36951]